jgi:hypothetical protein
LKRKAKVKAAKSPEADKDIEIVFAICRALAKTTPGETVALRKRLGEAIVASLLGMDLPPDQEMARRAIVVAVRRGILAAVNPKATPSVGGNRPIAARPPAC